MNLCIFPLFFVTYIDCNLQYFSPDIFANHHPSLSGSLHRLMSQNELLHHFGTSDAEKVSNDSYHVVVIQEFTVRTSDLVDDYPGDLTPVTQAIKDTGYFKGNGSSYSRGNFRPTVYPKTRRLLIVLPISRFDRRERYIRSTCGLAVLEKCSRLSFDAF